MSEESAKTAHAAASRLFNGRRVSLDGRVVLDGTGSPHLLRPQSARVLQLLLQQAGEVAPKRAIVDQVWPNTAVTDDSLTQCIADIRRALGDDRRTVLETLPRVGFRLNPDASDEAAPNLRWLERLTVRAVFALTLACVALGAPWWAFSQSSPRVTDAGPPTVSVAASTGAAALRQRCFGFAQPLSLRAVGR